MSDKAWKQFERDVAALIGGARHWSNSGRAIDCTSARFVAQCKLVKNLSLEQLTALVESITAEGQKDGKVGLVAAKVRRGGGIKSPTLVVMDGETFARLLGTLRP